MTVAQAIKVGAAEFLAKPASNLELFDVVHHGTSDVGHGIDKGAPDTPLTNSWVGRVSQTTWKRVAASDLPLLIEGETGTGKEMLARQIHASSPRADKPFVKLSCAALHGRFAEEELFGYERGVFACAFDGRPGKLELAQGGTILLDEICEMDIQVQAKLLDVLQDNEYARLGGRCRVPLDVRVMSASHCDLLRAIQRDCFRADLYYRLNVISVHVPPLRERKGEILAAAEFFLRKHHIGGDSLSLLTPALRHTLMEHHWPGNMRELENVMRRLLVMRNPDELRQQLMTCLGTGKTAKTTSATHCSVIVFPPKHRHGGKGFGGGVCD